MTTASRVYGLSTGSRTQSNEVVVKEPFHVAKNSFFAWLTRPASSNEQTKKRRVPMRPSQPGRRGTQSLAALVSSSRLTKSLSVRSIMQRSPAAQPTSV